MTLFHQFIKDHREDNVQELALHAKRYPETDIPKAVVQISGWQSARRKLPLWAATEGITYPAHLSLEQCSSQAAAEYKRHIVSRLFNVKEKGTLPSMTDLTGGFGVDSTMMAGCFDNLIFVEHQKELCDIAATNLPLLGVGHTEIINDDSERVLPRIAHQNLIYIDPARRDSHGGKTVAIQDCTPDVCRLNGLLLDKADIVMVKLSPMLDISLARRELRGIKEIHVVSVDGECKETLFLLSKDCIEEYAPRIYCANITQGGISEFPFTTEEERDAVCRYADTPGKYLYEPNASIMKACAFKSLASRFRMEKLHPSSHLYTSDTWHENFPGRKFMIESYTSFSKKELRQFIGGEKKANLTVRNFPATVNELRKKMKLSEGGDTYLFATTLSDGNHVIIRCRK
ncbi:MAG: class I SAM-dependent methyltransferase [Bacteroides sp.]|nr:class I SAM-dependent methyltransferase [Roseburia sp.]MCM1346360.1 class I SAM-dependent methyltransferase [Bacteroides sp.]MCM1420395.1 class I SAM-dependent methyltransferase [Bacteroides sp.]